MRKRMMALKPFAYSTRRMMAGDVFEVNSTTARALAAIKRARYMPEREMVEVPAPPPLPVSDIDALREEALSLGIKPDNRWKPETLRSKIEAARS